MEYAGSRNSLQGKSRFSGTKGTVLYVVLGVLIALGVNYGLGLALGTDLPIVAVESNSMVPAFAKGDILLLRGAQPEEIAVGEVIVFSPPQQSTPVVHRVVALNPDGTYQTKGDANARQLPYETDIQYNQVHGRMLFIVPLLGWVKLSVTEYALPNWPLVVVAAIAAYLLVYIVPGRLRRRKGRAEAYKARAARKGEISRTRR